MGWGRVNRQYGLSMSQYPLLVRPGIGNGGNPGFSAAQDRPMFGSTSSARKPRATFAPWNQGRAVGQRAAFSPEHVGVIRSLLAAAGHLRDLALFNTGVDTMLQASDLMALRVGDGRTQTACVNMSRIAGSCFRHRFPAPFRWSRCWSSGTGPRGRSPRSRRPADRRERAARPFHMRAGVHRPFRIGVGPDHSQRAAIDPHLGTQFERVSPLIAAPTAARLEVFRPGRRPKPRTGRRRSYRPAPWQRRRRLAAPHDPTSLQSGWRRCPRQAADGAADSAAAADVADQAGDDVRGAVSVDGEQGQHLPPVIGHVRVNPDGGLGHVEGLADLGGRPERPELSGSASGRHRAWSRRSRCGPGSGWVAPNMPTPAALSGALVGHLRARVTTHTSMPRSETILGQSRA